jgi:hypothetical protein
VAKIMTLISDPEIHEILSATAPVEQFCIYQPAGPSTISLLFYDPSTKSLWNYVNRDAEFTDAAAVYLKKMGRPVFSSHAQEEAYLKKVRQS